MKHDDEKKIARADRFRALVEAYGTNPDRWPASEREWANREARAPEQQAWLQEQSRLDEMLDGVSDIAPSPALRRRVAQVPLQFGASQASRWVWPFGRFRNVLAIGAAAAAMGILVGMTTPDLAADDPSADWEELSTLALGADLPEDLLP